MVVAAYRIEVNRRDVTDKWREERRLLSIEVTDKLGVSADSCSLELDDRPPHVAWPPVGARLRLWLGPSESELRDLGTYTVDAPEASGPPHRLRVSGHAASFVGGESVPMQTHRSRDWQSISLADMAEAIAADHGLNAKVGATLQGLTVGPLEQIDEPDLVFLERMAARSDARVRVRSGQLEVIPNGRLATNPIRLGVRDIEGWYAPLGERLKPGQVVARWNSPKSGKAGSVSVGKGDPVFILGDLFDSPDAARSSAESMIRTQERSSAELALALTSLRTDIGAGAAIEVSGLRSEVDGSWTATEVLHRTAGNTARSAITCQRSQP